MPLDPEEIYESRRKRSPMQQNAELDAFTRGCQVIADGGSLEDAKVVAGLAKPSKEQGRAVLMALAPEVYANRARQADDRRRRGVPPEEPRDGDL